MIICAISWNYSPLVIDFWKEQIESTKESTFGDFTKMVNSCLSETSDDELCSYESKVYACGLSKIYFDRECLSLCDEPQFETNL
jgi:hypothetical protein